MTHSRSEMQTLLTLAADDILRKAKRPTRSKPEPVRRPKSARIDHSRGVHVFADGACEPNPGPGAWAFVVIADGEEVHTSSGSAPMTTNNRMEMTSVIAALEWISDNAAGRPVNLYSDSQYVVNGCNEWRHGWKRKGWQRKGGAVVNADLWQALDAELTSRPQALTWVKGHSGIQGNERADRLASAALAAMKGSTRRVA